MKKSILKIIGTLILSMTLFLTLVGCTASNEEDDSYIHTILDPSNSKGDEDENIEHENIEDEKDKEDLSEEALNKEEGNVEEGKEEDKVNNIKDYLNKNPGGLGGSLKGEEIPFEAKIDKTGSYTSGKAFPKISVVKNKEDLGAIDYLSYGDKYDEEFFKTKALIVIELQETSGSVRNEVTKVVKNGEKITIGIKKTIPEIGTADMAEWAVYVEVDNSFVGDNTVVDIAFTTR